MKNILWILALVIAIGVILGLVLFSLQDDSSSEEEPEEIIDNRISPLTNQGVILQIDRIRHRGLLDKLLTPGSSWGTQPQFYFISNIDGLIYESNNVSALGAESEILFQGWDTILNENKVVKDVEENNTTADITFQIMERVPTGPRDRRTNDIEKEKIVLRYDFYTGRWEGHDSFMDDDGYGHYVGCDFEVWFNVYQTDYDNDGIPYWTEVNLLGTNPRIDDSKRDPDKDNVPTSWEWKWGYNPHSWDDHMALDPDIDGIENYEEYLMEGWFADPFQPDIYMEIDYMEPSPWGVKHELWMECQQAVIERFSQHGINLYIDDGWPNGPINGGGEQVQYYKTVSQDSGMMLQYYQHHFAPQRRGIFRYFVVGHSGSFTHPSLFYCYDTTALATSLIDRHLYQHFTYLLPSQLGPRVRADHPLSYHLPTPRTLRVTLAGQFMHETGHQLGILPWTIEGCDNYSSWETGDELIKVAEDWGNYYSVMNYFWLYRDKTLLDYSDGSHGRNDQNDWLEIYLPNFQMEGAPIIEDPDYYPPMPDNRVIEKRGFDPEGWVYSELVTQEFMDYIGEYSPLSPIPVQWRVYLKEVGEDNHNAPLDETCIRVHAFPLFSSTVVPDSEWTLISEGELDENGEFVFTSRSLFSH